MQALYVPKRWILQTDHQRFAAQGCQIFLGTTYQNGEKLTKWPQNIPIRHETY
jgi:hypothetical protein